MYVYICVYIYIISLLYIVRITIGNDRKAYITVNILLTDSHSVISLFISFQDRRRSTLNHPRGPVTTIPDLFILGFPYSWVYLVLGCRVLIYVRIYGGFLPVKWRYPNKNKFTRMLYETIHFFGYTTISSPKKSGHGRIFPTHPGAAVNLAGSTP